MTTVTYFDALYSVYFEFDLIFFIHSIQIYSLPSLTSDSSPFHTSSPPFLSHIWPPTNQTSKFPGASNLLKIRCTFSDWILTQQSSTAMCVGGLILTGECYLVGDPVSERSQASKIIETADPPTGLPSSSASSSFSLIQLQGSSDSVHWLGANNCIWISCFRVFWRAVMIGPCLWAFHSLSNSVRPWDLPLSWILLWACCWTFFLLRLLSISIPVILSDRKNCGSELWLWYGPPLPCLMPCLPVGSRLFKFPLPTVRDHQMKMVSRERSQGCPWKNADLNK
jgi:hypothetical protein